MCNILRQKKQYIGWRSVLYVAFFILSCPVLSATYTVSELLPTSFDTPSVVTTVSWDGTDTSYPNDDDKAVVNIGFPFTFKDTSYTQIRILTNGVLQFGADQRFHRIYGNSALPTNSADRFIAPYWDDLVDDAQSSVTYGMQGSAPSRSFVVTWNNVKAYTNNLRNDFQVVLYETGDIRFRYVNNTDNGISATIGIEVDDSDITQYSYNASSARTSFDLLFNNSLSGSHFSGKLNVDNTFSAYISTDDAVRGTLIGSGTNWPTTVDISSALTAGQTYYLHIYATDTGGVAGFLGEFDISGAEHTFSNGLRTLTTNTSNWRVSTSGWNNYQSATGYGTNGVSPWGTRAAVNSNAVWIWSSNNNSDNVNYFSTTINTTLPPEPPEIANVGSSCAALSTVTIVFSEDVEQSSAETIANYQVLKPSGTAVSINSAVRTSANTVTLGLANVLNDLTDYTVIINNIDDLTGDTIATNASDLFSISCSLNCINDSFVGPGSLSASWSASSSSGSFGIPRVVDNGRLRLTDASGQVATVATLLNQFPGADNKIEVEFDLYAYGGSGADGMVVTFSDASIPPVPGSYGGALGYAQRSGGGAGFAGGWLGVGLDEYGNFANPNEGKSGGSGFERDSIALRGSGSGTSGYPYLTSTGTLSPGIDQSGATPNPGHRYKITVDHTMGGGQAYVTVERNTGSGYLAVIPRFNIYSVNPSQAAVPENWVVSFTGSTGGATNIHEIGGLQVCAAKPISAYSSPDHYEISHSSQGITCEGSQVTVTAHDAAHNAFVMSSNINLSVSTSPAVDSIAPSTITIPAGSSSTRFYLRQSTALSNIDIDVTDGLATDVDGDTSGEDPRLNFVDTAFHFYANGSANTIPKQVAGVNTAGQNLTLKAIKTDDQSGACVPALQGSTPIEIAYECNSPTSCSSSGLMNFEGQTLTGDNQGIGPSYTSVPMVFDSNGEADFDFKFADAGQLTLRARKAVAANYPDPAFTLNGTSNAFWVRPSALQLSAQSAGSVINGDSSNSGTTHKAGEPFELVVRAVNDAGVVTPNYRPGQLQLKLTRTGPTTPSAVGSEGVLTYFNSGSRTTALAGSATFSDVTLESFVGGDLGNGISQNKTVSYSEVGLINLAIQDVNYGGLLDPIPEVSIDVGRFYPDHFDLALTPASFGNSCNSFTYLDQDFFFDTAPQLTIEAKNVAGDITKNYEGEYWKLGGSLLQQSGCDGAGVGTIKGFCYSDNLTGAASLVATNASQSYGSLDDLNGQITMNLHNQAIHRFKYSRPANSYSLPFDADIKLQIELEDTDGVAASMSLNNIGFSLDTDTAAAGFNSSNNQLLRHGRWKMENAYGPETQNLAIQAHAEYFSFRNKFEFNGDDYCTALTNADITLNSGLSNAPVTIGSSSSNFSFNTPLVLNEDENFLLTAPGATHTGDVSINVDLTNLPWLQFDWNQDGNLINHPAIKATFGQYRGHDRIIYWREVSN